MLKLESIQDLSWPESSLQHREPSSMVARPIMTIVSHPMQDIDRNRVRQRALNPLLIVCADSARSDALGKGQLPSAVPLSSVLDKIKQRAAAAAARSASHHAHVAFRAFLRNV